MTAGYRSLLLAALGLAVIAPEASAQSRRPERRPQPRCERGDDDCRDRRDDRRTRRVRQAPEREGVALGLYGGSVDGMPTGGVRLGVGRVRLYAEGSDDRNWDHHTRDYDGGDAPEQSAFGIDVTLPARAPGLRALYGIAGVGVQHNNRREDVYAYADCGPSYCSYPAYAGRGEDAFYGTLGLGMRLPLWRGRVAVSGEVAGRFVADRYERGYTVPTANVGVSVRLR